MALFESVTATQLTHIPYKGSGPAIQDVLGGQVQVFMTTPPSVMQHVQAGKLKAFAVTGKSRHPGLPDVPTTAEAGLPGFELEAWVALFAPTGTPASVVQTLAGKVEAALASPEAKGLADRAGVEIRYSSPEGLGQLVAKDTDYWAEIIKSRNIRSD
jgi:tripartite-type tricarboxylate transporter receptor subunit TctC